jgi:hypothetical protein
LKKCIKQNIVIIYNNEKDTARPMAIEVASLTPLLITGLSESPYPCDSVGTGVSTTYSVGLEESVSEGVSLGVAVS